MLLEVCLVGIHSCTTTVPGTFGVQAVSETVFPRAFRRVTGLGHLEGAAGIAGLIKAVMALEQRQVPPNLHFEKLNPHIDVDGFPCIFPTSLVMESARALSYYVIST